jgi:hypothetical protein
MRMIIGRAAVDFVRLRDDERYPASMIVGVTLRGESKVVLRGVWDVDTWETWRAHQWFDRPVMLSAEMSREDPGIVVKVSAVVPVRYLPRETWPDEFRGEAWQGEHTLPPMEVGGLLPLGTLVRYARKFEFRGILPDEGMSVIQSALRGNTSEPWEQGLSV